MPIPFVAAPLSALLFGSAAASFFGIVIPAIVWLIIRSLGVAAITYVGLGLIQGQVARLIEQSLADVHAQYAQVYNLLGTMNLDIFINSVLSAFAARLAIKFFCRPGGKYRQLDMFGSPPC